MYGALSNGCGSLTAASVSELNDYIQRLISCDEGLQTVYVQGEISNFTDHRSGHLYFTLKDEQSAIRAVMFRREAAGLRFRPSDGMRVTVFGRVDVFKAAGQYQLYVSLMQPDGIGNLALLYEQLKAKLTAEGLFDAARKKKIPRYPRKIGVITSPTGAAVRDIMNILGRRYPSADILLYPSLVQGNEAPSDIAKGIRWFSDHQAADVLIFGRGGGSMEDLFAFNTEEVVRAVAACRIPTISAVGHETDWTLSDFAADLRAPTPSAAAELAVPDRKELQSRISLLGDSAINAVYELLKRQRKELDRFGSARTMRMPQVLLEERELQLARLGEKLESSGKLRLEKAEHALQKASASLDALSPLSTLARGYAVVYRGTDDQKEMLFRASSVKEGDSVTLRFADGSVRACAEKIDLNKKKQLSKKER